MDKLLQDLRFALRTLAKQPVFTAVAVLSLALGIGANAAVFSFVDAFVLRPMPYEQPEELLHLWGQSRRGQMRVSAPNFVDWREQSTKFADMAAFNYTIETLTSGEFPEQISGGRISANTFDLLGVQPALGRDFADGEDSSAAAPAAILSDHFWAERYGRDAAVLGRTLEIDQLAYTVVGVMPPGVNFPLPSTQVWLPRLLDDQKSTRERGILQVVGRLAPGTTAEQAQEEMSQIAARLQQQYPEANADVGVSLVPLRAALNFAWDIIQPMSALLMAAVGFVLLIGCANVASLTLARASTRERELAVRTALGAGRNRLIRQMLTESAVLAALGGAVGVLVARFLLVSLDGTIPGDLYRVGGLQLNTTALAFAGVLSLLTVLLFGSVPALRASRTDLVESLKEGTGGSGTGSRKLGLQSAMVAIEMTLAVILLVGTVLMARTLGNLQAVDPGFGREGVLSARMLLDESTYATLAEVADFHRRVVEEAAGVPGVVEAATVDYLPLNHETNGVEFEIVGQPRPEEPWGALLLSVSPEYFRVMEIPLLSGTGFDASDDLDAVWVGVVDETFAERHFGDGQAVGRQLHIDGDRTVTIVGVAGASRQVDLATSPEPLLYLSQRQIPRRYMRLLVRTQGDPASLVSTVRAAVADIDPRLPLSEVRTMVQVVDDFLLPQALLANSMGVLAAGALLLAAIGVYGLMDFFVSQRIRDIGIHVALGATRNRVRVMIADRVLRLAAAGVAVGMLAALGLMQLLGSFLYGVDAADPGAFALAAIFLVVVALTAGIMGARRATRIDPMVALRGD